MPRKRRHATYRRGRAQRRQDRADTVSKDLATGSCKPRPSYEGQNQHRLRDPRAQGRQRAPGLHLQRLRPRGLLRRDGRAGRELHDGRACDDRLDDGGKRHLEWQGCL